MLRWVWRSSIFWLITAAGGDLYVGINKRAIAMSKKDAHREHPRSWRLLSVRQPQGRASINGPSWSPSVRPLIHSQNLKGIDLDQGDYQAARTRGHN